MTTNLAENINSILKRFRKKIKKKEKFYDIDKVVYQVHATSS